METTSVNTVKNGMRLVEIIAGQRPQQYPCPCRPQQTTYVGNNEGYCILCGRIVTYADHVDGTAVWQSILPDVAAADLLELAEHYNWAECCYDNNNILVRSLTGGEGSTDWYPVTDQQILDWEAAR